MICFPNAKINLGLHIVSRRNDGYHNIESLMLPIDYCDILEILADSGSKSCSLSISGVIPDGSLRDNLCCKAFDLMHHIYGISGVKIHLHKNIATGAGLGGGSSDAAFTLISLNKLFNLQLSDDTLGELAAKLGSDCAFFIENKPALASGKGDILKHFDINVSNNYLLLILPDIHISTALAYSNCVAGKHKIALTELLQTPKTNWPQRIENDFEETVFNTHPKLSEIKNELYKLGALYASMSGSGSTIYGFFDKKPELSEYLKDYKHLITRVL